MDKTKNYQLNQWAAGDKVQRIDFNADNDKIDGAIAAVSARAGALETGKADKTALDAAKATIPKIAAGSYTGSGAASRTISLSFTPKAVLVMTQDGHTRSSNYIMGGLAVTGSPVKIVNGAEEFTAVTLVSNGFRVYYNIDDDYYKVQSNFKDRTYHYIAFG
ncbi:hypothetical protein D7V91_16950 [bacterium 1xD42-67]|nr:hypothetical protein [Lawsonibacter sp.]RKI63960.1 hypothetical protein D7V91_16950 [bacterium 1xD42-67]